MSKEVVTFQLRRGTTSEWNSASTRLAQGEPGFDTVTNQLKIGNGSSSWSQLKSFYPATQPPANFVDATSPINIGYEAGITDGYATIAIGSNAGSSAQGDYCIAVGYDAGQINQASASIAIGHSAGNTGQEIGSVAIGTGAGQTGQQTYSVAIGTGAAQIGQGQSSVAIGLNAGNTSQSDYSVAIGTGAAQTGQGQSSVAIGQQAGQTGQSDYSVAIGQQAGQTGQHFFTVAIGLQAGQTNQLENSIAIGDQAGQTEQQEESVAIGDQAGQTNQQAYSVAIGYNAGQIEQGYSSVAIGAAAGQTDQASNTIILNASSFPLNGVPGQTGSFYVSPIRSATGPQALLYNPTTYEITYGSAGSSGGTYPQDITCSTLTATGAISSGTLGVTGGITCSTLTATGAITSGTLGVTGGITSGTLGVTGGITCGTLSTKTIYDVSGSSGTTGQILSAGVTGGSLQWIAAPTGGSGGSYPQDISCNTLVVAEGITCDNLVANNGVHVTGGSTFNGTVFASDLSSNNGLTVNGAITCGGSVVVGTTGTDGSIIKLQTTSGTVGFYGDSGIMRIQAQQPDGSTNAPLLLNAASGNNVGAVLTGSNLVVGTGLNGNQNAGSANINCGTLVVNGSIAATSILAASLPGTANQLLSAGPAGGALSWVNGISSIQTNGNGSYITIGNLLIQYGSTVSFDTNSGYGGVSITYPQPFSSNSVFVTITEIFGFSLPGSYSPMLGSSSATAAVFSVSKVGITYIWFAVGTAP
jgi:hypothetical protein